MLSEDIVAIILLTLLGSYVQFGPAAGHAGAVRTDSLVQTLALFAGFVLLLAVLGLLLIPRVLRRLSRDATAELETIFVAGLLFGLSFIVVKAGYSLALGAFLLGAIIGETPQRDHVERAFAGMKAVFGMMFFVAIGMTIDVRHAFPSAVVPLLLMTVLALVGRSLAALGAGATDKGAPGLRPHYHEHYYGAFVLDPDGYNVEAVCHRAP
jgi:CPA2 family monovalent cation:H+ antiporter-2